MVVVDLFDKTGGLSIPEVFMLFLRECSVKRTQIKNWWWGG
jgi:hypothetical protein